MRKISACILLAGLTALTGCEEEEILPSDPVGKLVSQASGYVTDQGVMISSSLEPTWVQYAVKNYKQQDGSETPSAIDFVEAPSQCQFVAPAEGSAVKYFAVDDSNTPTGVKAANAEDLNNGSAQTAMSDDKTSTDFRVVDVIVGASEQPVYLVLMNHANIVWNLNVSPAAKLQHVAVIGKDKSAVANVPKGVSVEILEGKKLRICNVLPFRQPGDDWKLVQDAKTDNKKSKLLDQVLIGFNRYKTWLEGQFGSYGQMETVSSKVASHMMSGKLPVELADRQEYRSLAGATVLMTEKELTSANGEEDFTAALDQLKKKQAEENTADNAKSGNSNS